MILGFTGTQKGMTKSQILKLREFIIQLQPKAIHLGDCIGADHQCYVIITTIFPGVITFGHIPVNKSKRAYCKYSVERKPLPYLDRNKEIVKSSDILLATPAEENEKLRSGTWSTIRYANYTKKPIIIIYPNGTYAYRNAKTKITENRILE